MEGTKKLMVESNDDGIRASQDYLGMVGRIKRENKAI